MKTPLHTVLDHLHRACRPPEGVLTDGQLLARFLAARDEAAFTTLVRRHGPMVLGVCRRLLRHTQDAEDAFQATFLVLARKASSVRGEAVGSWLYAVAYRTALEARAVNLRRRTRERQVEKMPHPEIPPLEPQDWRPWLDHELHLLPARYREVIVACDLEGFSRKEAAQRLGLAEGTLSSRLARGRRLLARRLSRYGLSLSGGALALALSESASAAVPTPLLVTTVQAALGRLAVAAGADILLRGVLKAMFLTKLKLMVGAVMVAVALGAGGLAYRAGSGPGQVQAAPPESKPRNELEALRRENELLKLNLEVVLEKVRAQEAELRALRRDGRSIGKAAAKPEDLPKTVEALKTDLSQWEERALWSRRMSGRGYVTVAQAEADEARQRAARAALGEAEARLEALRWQEVEATLKALREAPDRASRQRAADALEKALKDLRKQRDKPEGSRGR